VDKKINRDSFPPRDHCHDDIFGRHERQLSRDAVFDDLLVDDDALEDVLQSHQDRVGSQKRFWQSDSSEKNVVLDKTPILKVF